MKRSGRSGGHTGELWPRSSGAGAPAFAGTGTAKATYPRPFWTHHAGSTPPDERKTCRDRPHGPVSAGAVITLTLNWVQQDEPGPP